MNKDIQAIDAKAGALLKKEQKLISLNQTQLESVVSGDWYTYCSHDFTCCEAEANGVLAEGLAFHQFYLELPPAQNSPASPT